MGLDMLLRSSSCFPSASRKFSRTLEEKTLRMLVIKLVSSHMLLEGEESFVKLLDREFLVLPVARTAAFHQIGPEFGGTHK